jgi:hypothetical protein
MAGGGNRMRQGLCLARVGEVSPAWTLAGKGPLSSRAAEVGKWWRKGDGQAWVKLTHRLLRGWWKKGSDKRVLQSSEKKLAAQSRDSAKDGAQQSGCEECVYCELTS